jgi:hypothetical protein
MPISEQMDLEALEEPVLAGPALVMRDAMRLS